LTEIDRWALMETEELRQRVTEAYRQFDFHRVYREIHNFCVIPMSSFYLDVLKDRLYTYPPKSSARLSSQTALWEIIVILAKLLAPILCFTTEEVWDQLRERGDFPESIHLSGFPEPRPQWRDEALKRDWEKLLLLRAQVLKYLEGPRRAGEIGNPLEAKVIIQAGDEEWAEFLKRHQALLPMILIVSQVEIEEIPPSGQGSGEAGEIERIWIRVERAGGSKCSRCWKYSPTVGQSPEHPELCRECVGHLDQIN
jgi:isoleucyl-tRNA synthetase